MDGQHKDEPLNKKQLIHETCGKRHIDEGEFAQKNHERHLCFYCEEFFYDSEPGVGM